MTKIISETIGWLGMMLILLAFFLVSFGFLAPHSISFQGLNILGSAGLMYISFKKKAYQPAVLNIVWMIIAIIAIAR